MTKCRKYSWEKMFCIRIHKQNIEYGQLNFCYYESCVIISKLYEEHATIKCNYEEYH